MDCKISGESLIDFHFGKIIPAERVRVENHLSTCAACLQEYFGIKRDLEVASVHEKPSELVRYRIKRDFAAYCESLLSEDKREWFYLNRVRLAVAFSVAAAALLVILFSNPLRFAMRLDPSIPKPPAQSEGLKSLDEAVDSGRLSPGHINMI